MIISLTDLYVKLDTSEKELIGVSKDKEVSLKRHLLHWYMRKMGYKFREIGALTNRDHSTVIHSCKTIDNLIETKDCSTMELLNKLLNSK